MPVSQISPNRSLGLDLLRAAAVLMVLLSHWTSHFGGWFHVHVPAMVDTLGDIGVEIFFALSGFLIGRILINLTASRPTWEDFRIFMLRRAMRTLPLYFLWLTLLLWAFPPRQDALVTAMRFLTLTQNLITDMPADYYFIVTWSLTIEEWFYLLFGASLILLSQRFGGRRALLCCIAGFILAPLALRLGYTQRSPLVFFRIDEIAYGVIMARLYLDRSRLFSQPWPPLALGLTCIATALFGLLPVPDHLAIPLTSNVEVIGGALCLPAALRLCGAVWWFETPIRWVAGRSYALYLMHLTLLVDVVERQFLEPGLLAAPVCALLAVALPFPLAEISYRFLETPLLRLRPDHQRPRRSTRSAMAAATG